MNIYPYICFGGDRLAPVKVNHLWRPVGNCCVSEINNGLLCFIIKFANSISGEFHIKG